MQPLHTRVGIPGGGFEYGFGERKIVYLVSSKSRDSIHATGPLSAVFLLRWSMLRGYLIDHYETLP